MRLGWFRVGEAREKHPAFAEHLDGGAGFWNVMRLYPEESLGVALMGNTPSYDHESILDTAVGRAWGMKSTPHPTAGCTRCLEGRWVSPLEFVEALADTWNVMRYDVHPPDFSKVEAVDEADLSFAAFSLEHASCGDDVLEVRLGEETLLEWCMACAVMMIFRTGKL